MKRILTLALICLPFLSISQQRFNINLNAKWAFTKGEVLPLNSLGWTEVSLPHTWNKTDVMDDEPGYYRGNGFYKKLIYANFSWANKTVFLEFEGVNQVAEVFINGRKAAYHIGGYTKFAVPISEFLSYGKNSINEIVIKVNNNHNDDIPPLSGDFTFFGGIYRDVNLIVTNPVHFSFKDASTGVFISTPSVSAERASVNVKGLLVNSTSISKRITVLSVIKDKDGRLVKEKKSSFIINRNSEAEYAHRIDFIENPHLWSPEDPYLYTVTSKIYDTKSKALLDEVINPLGFRWFKFDAAKGFFLNGNHYKLIGASRHQDYQGLGNALPNEYHYRDVKLLKEMGANFLRVAHYPQDPAILQACDRLGILASVEIPIVNAITESEAFTQNSKNMQVEMMRQNYNHPSLIIWAYMNEVLLRPKFNEDKERQQVYFNNIKKLAQQLEDLTRKEDPSRYTMMSNHGYFNGYRDAGLIQIPMLIGWNLYQGWYGGKATDFGAFLDRHHKEFPDKPLLVTEYGADADPRIRSREPERFDKSVEYSLYYHQTYLDAIQQRPFVAGAMVWNLADFNSESREETMPHINNKGLLTWNRQKKDLYYLYQAHLSKQPFIKLSNWNLRAGKTDSLKDFSTQAVSVFSNSDFVELLLNGVLIGKRKVEQNIAIFNVPFIDGLNTLEARQTSGTRIYNDISNVNFQLLSGNLKNDLQYDGLNILLGAKRYFLDESTQQLWIPDRAYTKNLWGHIGGSPFKLPESNRQGYGTDRNIRDTEEDPIYQTQQIGIQKYKLDVPDGMYELSLHFAELISDEKKEVLVYNLDNSVRDEKAETRVFDVFVNDKLYLNNYNIALQFGSLKAVKETFNIVSDNGKGIEISFRPIIGEPVLNALQIRRIY